jgi:probable HAF family extracellular repeat protein
LLLSSLLGAGVSADARPATFNVFPSPNGLPVFGLALAASGNAMAANYGGEIYLWTPAKGFMDLGAGDPYNPTIGISSSGYYVVATRPGQDGNSSPARWNRVAGWLDLGHPANGCPLSGNWGSGYGVSHDGSVVVGLAWDCQVRAEGFAWTQQGGMVSLGRPLGKSSRASAISADASTVVGFFEDPQMGFRRAIRWRNGKKDLIAGVHTPGEAAAVSSDGQQIVGQASPSAFPGGAAFYYTDRLGLVPLGTISNSPSDQSFANGVSDDGTVVGWSGSFSGGLQAFIWSSKVHKAKMVSLRDSLIRRGAQIPTGLTLTTALAISADGSVVVGSWQDASFHSGAFIARLN